jgi:hypothetical protein
MLTVINWDNYNMSLYVYRMSVTKNTWLHYQLLRMDILIIILLCIIKYNTK